tara:strand:+ start:2662 stop:3162 length:501 start_codon:yes stop_codon:yes gene_type:complete
MIRDFNNFISDSNRSIKKTMAFTINEQPNTAYILGAFSIGILGAMIYRSNGNGIENSQSYSETIMPIPIYNETDPEQQNEIIDQPLLAAPTENAFIPSISETQESPPNEFQQMDQSVTSDSIQSEDSDSSSEKTEQPKPENEKTQQDTKEKEKTSVDSVVFDDELL